MTESIELKKFLAFFLIVTMLSSASILSICNAENSISQPSVPEFTVKVVSYPYSVPPTNTTDPYTGEVTTHPGYVDENKSVEVSIKNQPFTSYKDTNGNWINLYYELRWKGHFSSDEWDYYPVSPAFAQFGYINASLSDYTVVSIPRGTLTPNFPAGSQLDFQAQALIGYYEKEYNFALGMPTGIHFAGESSDWSNQTLTIPEPVDNGSGVGLSWEQTTIVIIVVAIALLAVALVIFSRKIGRRKQQSLQNKK